MISARSFLCPIIQPSLAPAAASAGQNNIDANTISTINDLLTQVNSVNQSLNNQINDFNNQVTITSVEIVSDPTLNNDIGFTQGQGTCLEDD